MKMKNYLYALAMTTAFGCSHKPAQKLSVERDSVRSTIKTHLGEVKKCYTTELKQDPKLERKVVVDFDINFEGKVIKSESNPVKTTLKNENLLNCIKQVITAIQFTPLQTDPKIIATVSYPFLFKKGSVESLPVND